MKKVKWLWCTALSVFLIQCNDCNAMRRMPKKQGTGRSVDICAPKDFSLSEEEVRAAEMVRGALLVASDLEVLSPEGQADVQRFERAVGTILETHGRNCFALTGIEVSLDHVATRNHFPNCCLTLNIVSGRVREGDAMPRYIADIGCCLTHSEGCVLNMIELMKQHRRLAQMLLPLAQAGANESELLLKSLLFLLEEKNDQLVCGLLSSGPYVNLGIQIPETPCYKFSGTPGTAVSCMHPLLVILHRAGRNRYKVATMFADSRPDRIWRELPKDFDPVTLYKPESTIVEIQWRAVYEEYIKSLGETELDLIRDVARAEGGEMDRPAREGVVAFLADQHRRETGREMRATREDRVVAILEENVLAGRWGNWEVVTLLHFLLTPLVNMNVYGKLFRLGLLTEDLVVVNAVIKHMDTMKMDAKKVTALEIPDYDGSFTMFFLTNNALHPLMFFIKNYPDRFRDEVNRHVPLAEYCDKFMELCMGTPLCLAAATMGDSKTEQSTFKAMVDASGLTDFWATDELTFVPPIVAAMTRSGREMLSILTSKQKQIKIGTNLVGQLQHADTFFPDENSRRSIRNSFGSIIKSTKWTLDDTAVTALLTYGEKVDFDVVNTLLDRIIVHEGPENQAFTYMRCSGFTFIELAAQRLYQERLLSVLKKYDNFSKKLKNRGLQEKMILVIAGIRAGVRAAELPEAERNQELDRIYRTLGASRSRQNH
ncbi:MAG: hypothetical protein LBG20_04580 [Holosporaceae bacterium]|jgi:hypothetical protein|nr:hypothetical protein [Holosporaceae bacterium]